MRKKLLISFCVLFGALSLAAQSFAADKFGADRHTAKGVQCAACHGPDPKNPIYPEEAQCVACHDKAALAKKTQNLPQANPHAAPPNGDCTLCHMQHEPAVNYCAQCHNFKFNVK